MTDTTTPAMARDLRRAGADLALEHLQRLGGTLVAREHRTRWGDIDLVIHVDGHLVFVEVDTRRAGAAPRADGRAPDQRKRAQVRRTAAAFLAEVQDRPRASELRFDAIAVVVDADD